MLHPDHLQHGSGGISSTSSAGGGSSGSLTSEGTTASPPSAPSAPLRPADQLATTGRVTPTQPSYDTSNRPPGGRRPSAGSVRAMATTVVQSPPVMAEVVYDDTDPEQGVRALPVAVARVREV